MRKITLTAVIIMIYSVCFSQELVFKTGKNITNYDYTSENGSAPSLQAGQGNFYELAYNRRVYKQKLQLSTGLSLNEYNALGNNLNATYSWNTLYAGIQNSLGLVVLKKSGFEGSAWAGMGIETLIYGKQNLNGQFMDLWKQKEFAGLWVSPKLGISILYQCMDNVGLSFGYSYAKSFNLSNNTPEKLSFNNQQLQFGIHIRLQE